MEVRGSRLGSVSTFSPQCRLNRSVSTIVRGCFLNVSLPFPRSADGTLLHICLFRTYASLRTLWKLRCSLATVLAWIIVTCPYNADAACVAEKATTGFEQGLVVHLSPDCTSAEREARVVRSEAILATIARGGSVDLLGVIVRGDLLFDHLAVSLPIPDSEATNQANRADGHGQRIIRGTLRIRDSMVLGAVRHRSTEGTLRFEGTVDFYRSHFKEDVDLSRSVFEGPVELSGAIFEKAAYFVQGQFAQPMNCEATRFGPSTRFHRSVFRDSVNCVGALFDGMAEFLEVNFEQPVVFERARFGLGTGFSGSRFKSRVSFSDAIFSRETFFGFTVFENEAVFAGAQFLGSADFSNAEFRQPDDLARARFDQPPLFTSAKRNESTQSTGFLQTESGQYVVTLAFLIVAALLVAYAVKLK